MQAKAPTKPQDSQMQSPSERDMIFERFLNTNPFQPIPAVSKEAVIGPAPASGNRRRPGSVASVCSQSSNSHTCYNAEDFIAPVLDSTAEILSNPNADLSNVTVVCCDDDQRKDSSSSALDQSVMGVKRSRSLVCNKLLNSLDDQSYKSSSSKTSVSGPGGSEQTINFYSFAESLEKEEESDNFNSWKMSELCS